MIYRKKITKDLVFIIEKIDQQKVRIMRSGNNPTFLSLNVVSVVNFTQLQHAKWLFSSKFSTKNTLILSPVDQPFWKYLLTTCSTHHSQHRSTHFSTIQPYKISTNTHCRPELGSLNETKRSKKKLDPTRPKSSAALLQQAKQNLSQQFS